jgi:hypothetical protein
LLADIERKMAAAQDPIVSEDFLGHESENQQGLNPGKAEQQVHVLDAQKATVSEDIYKKTVMFAWHNKDSPRL